MQLSVFRTDPRLAGMLFARSPLAADTGRQALEEMMESFPEIQARLVVGGLSTICRWRKFALWSGRVQAAYPERFAIDVWPWDSHGVALAPQQPRLVSSLESIVEQAEIP
jgi:hypothetical protein